MTGEIVAFRDREWGAFDSTIQVESIKGWEDFTARAQNPAAVAPFSSGSSSV